jgi:hypothetical protein
VPAIPGPLAEQNARVYRRYAALQQVLSLGHAAVSVEPDVLLLSDPLPLLHQHPTDVTVMSTTSGDEHSAYGGLMSASASTSPMSLVYVHIRDVSFLGQASLLSGLVNLVRLQDASCVCLELQMGVFDPYQ